MKFNNQQLNTRRKERFSASNLFFVCFSFLRRIKKSVGLMTRVEKWAVLILFISVLLMLSVRINNALGAKTQTMPAPGGEYREAVVGELKYLNPLLAQTDTDRALSKLIFPGLIKISGDQVLPDIAEKWEIGDGGLKYIFTLNKQVVFHDGARLTANDVASTIDLIKNESDAKNWLYDAWKDVEVRVEDEYKITFVLPKPYGPFIYNCNFGILPEHVSQDELSRKFIGAGPFQFDSTLSANHRVTQLKLKKNQSYYGVQPYLEKVVFIFYTDKNLAHKAMIGGEVQALSGMPSEGSRLINLSYKSSRQLGLIFNLRNEAVKEKEIRRKIIAGEQFPDKLQLKLTTLGGELQRAKAEEIKSVLASQNIDLTIIYLSSVQLKEALDEHDYELLLYGFDFSFDRDPYVFWHSSQLGKLNFAGFSDKNSDILLEDARMLTDNKERNVKYDLFFNTIKNENLAVFYEPIRYPFYINLELKGASVIKGHEAYSRYENIDKWYLKEKKVRR